MNTDQILIDRSVNSSNANETMNALFAPQVSRNTTPRIVTSLVNLKNQLVHKLSAEFSDVESHFVRQAVNEADSLVFQTTVPQLLLPVLAEEKVLALRNWTLRQRAVEKQTATISLAA